MALAASGEVPSAPGLLRRLACFLYEGVLLFAVLMIAGYMFSSLTQQQHALQGRALLQAFLFLVLGVYFVWFWSHGGQTLAMKTWRIRLVGAGGQPVSQARAFARYLMSWLWFAPALIVLWVAETAGLGTIFTCLATGVLAYASLALLSPQRQFLHDTICATRLVSMPAR